MAGKEKGQNASAVALTLNQQLLLCPHTAWERNVPVVDKASQVK